jgi:hypothetical protein
MPFFILPLLYAGAGALVGGSIVNTAIDVFGDDSDPSQPNPIAEYSILDTFKILALVGGGYFIYKKANA